MRAVAGVTVMPFLSPLPHDSHLANALRQANPGQIVELTILIYRYSFLLYRAALDTMYVAAQSRLGFRGTKNSPDDREVARWRIHSSMDMAERSQVALNCRSFRGEFHCYRSPAKRSTEVGGRFDKYVHLLNIINLMIVNPISITSLF